MVPPEPSVAAVPVTVNPPLFPVLFSVIPLALPLAEILWKVIPLAPIVELTTFKAVPVVEEMVFPVPVTLIAAAPPVALKPVAVDEVIVSPPPLKLIVVPPLLANVTGVTVGVFNVFVVPLKLIVPPVQLDTFIPVLVPVEERLPDKVTVPPVTL